MEPLVDQNAGAAFLKLLPQLTLEEKVNLLSGSSFRGTGGVPRLGIPPLKTVDSVNGIRPDDFQTDVVTTAAFPNTTCLASTWNAPLLRQMGEELAREARRKSAQIVLGPTVNIHRDPRAGRNFECFSEDPLLSGQLAAAIVNGIQSHGVGACPKHFVCNDSETLRKVYNVDESLDGRVVREIYLAAFQHLLRNSRPVGLMTAYNKVDGAYCSENTPLLSGILRGTWGFDGITMSDWFGTYSTVAAANAGLDLEMPFPVFRKDKLVKAVQDGSVTEQTLDLAVANLLRLRDRTVASHSEAPERSEIRKETNDMAYKTASEGIVLLKNIAGVLPLDPSTVAKVAVIGEYATDPVITGGGSASCVPQYKDLPLELLQEAWGGSENVMHATGVRTCVILPTLPPQKLRSTEGCQGVDIAYYNNDNPHPILTEFQADASVYMLGQYKPGLSLDGSRLEMTTTLTPATTGLHTIAVRATGAFRFLVNGDEVLSRPEPDITTEESLFCHFKLESRVRVDMKAGGSYALKLVMQSRTPMKFEPTPYGATLGFQEYIPEDVAIAEAAEAARNSGVAIVYAGRGPQHESEGFDLADMDMPANQTALIKAVAAAADKTVLVLHCGNPIDVTPFVDDVDAILVGHFPGQEGARAIVDIITGKVNPSGKLGTTWFKTIEHVPSRDNFPARKSEDGKVDLQYAEGLSVGYRGDDAETGARWPFGFGLSYSSFSFSPLRLEVVENDAGEQRLLRCSISVTNTGAIAGKEVVPLYIRPPSSAIWRPKRELKAFSKVSLGPGEIRDVALEVNLDIACSYWDETEKAWLQQAGEYGAQVGDSVVPFKVVKSKHWNSL
ncbi:thermostable beta-glucosidase B [Thozetella sp. PMI_491]|nr:thermostable beta-glucosidase B [Thozetella sp. PMI_491]